MDEETKTNQPVTPVTEMATLVYHLLHGTLSPSDIALAKKLTQQNWIAIIAGGNPEFPECVQEEALLNYQKVYK